MGKTTNCKLLCLFIESKHLSECFFKRAHNGHALRHGGSHTFAHKLHHLHIRLQSLVGRCNRFILSSPVKNDDKVGFGKRTHELINHGIV